MMRRLRLGLLPLALLAAACGTKTIKADGAEKSVDDLVNKQTGFQSTDTKCPDGVDAKVGGTFDCHFTGPDGDYVAHMKITKVDGERVLFRIKTEPER